MNGSVDVWAELLQPFLRFCIFRRLSNIILHMETS